MVRLNYSQSLAMQHVSAVIDRIGKTYDESAILGYIEKLGTKTIEEFLLADVSTMKEWVKSFPELLCFTEFKDMYGRFFSNGSKIYLADGYNAYSFIEGLGVEVCPYCDDEYIDIIDDGDHGKRTSEVDHFFPKSKYPGLAMCFYNLVPCGQVCNGLKLEKDLGSSPYEINIEDETFLFPDLPIGVAIDKVEPESCVIRFHPQNGMKTNVETLYLEQRYERHAGEVHRLLLNLQLYSPEKIDELANMGFGSREQIISNIFAPQDPLEKKKALRQKMVRDLTGY